MNISEIPLIDLEFHALIPPLSPEEFTQLETNILKDGCRDALVLWKGFSILVDGHNRFAICEKHGLPYKTKELDFDTRESVCDWIDANQLGRRNLTPDQRKVLLGRRFNRRKGSPGGDRKSKYRTCILMDTATELSKEYGVSRGTVINAGKAAEFVEQLAKVAPAEAQAVRDGTKRINEVRRTVRRAEVQEAAKLPDAKYRVIYADPPWKYGDQLTEAYGATKFHYPAMSIGELCGLPIAALCEKNAVLFLWVTSPLLFECAPVIKAWGFEYKSSFVWDKIKHNMGHYNSVRHEFLLVCTRGSCLPDIPELIDSVQSIERTKHSEKPEEFRAIIDKLYPHGKRIELFARMEARDWERWGNQS